MAPPRFELAHGLAAPDPGRTMSTATTWAFGPGFSEEEWLAVASRLVGHERGREHVGFALDELGRHVVQDGEAVYRVDHRNLAACVISWQ